MNNIQKLSMILGLFGVLFSLPASGQDPRVTTFNQTGDKAATVTILGYRGTDNKSYVLSKDPAIAGLPVNIVNGGDVGGGDLSFLRNAVSTTASLDTSTPANNRPVPFTLLAGDSLGPVAVGSGNTTATTLRFRLVDDQSLAFACATCATETTLAALNSKVVQGAGSSAGAIRTYANAGFQGNDVTRVNSLPVSPVSPFRTDTLVINSAGVTFTYDQTIANFANFGMLSFNVTGIGSNVVRFERNNGNSSNFFTVPIYNILTNSFQSNLTDGQFLVDISGASKFQFNTTSYVSGTVGLFIGFGSLTGTTLPQNISASSLPLPSGASTSALQTTGNASLGSIDSKTPALGQALAAASVPVVLPAAQISTLTPQTNALTDTQLRASAVPVSIGTLPLPTGGATSALQTTGNASLSSIDGKRATLVSGRVPVDGSGVTQPISAATLPLPSGASTFAGQTTGNNSLAQIDGKLNLAFGAASSAVRTASLIGNISGVADFGAGAVSAQTLRVAPVTEANPRTGKAVVLTSRQNLSSVAINTTYTQITASTSATISKCSVFWPGNEPLWLSTGGGGSEVVLVYVPPGGQDDIPVSIAASTRLAWRSEASTFSSGFGVITCYGI
jgi:hypothetical protein